MADCSTCTGSTACTKCANSKYLKSDKTGCVASCSNDPKASNVYSDSTTGDMKCLFCNSSMTDCVSCDSSSKCTKCGNGKYLKSDFSGCIAACTSDPKS